MKLLLLTTFAVSVVLAQPLASTILLPKSESVECLALNIYHEARGQGSAGELAVTAVVLNRVNDSR